MGSDNVRVIVVTDTSVVLNLAFLGEERLLELLFVRVFAPPQVREEFQRLALTDPRFRGLAFPEFIIVESPETIPESLRDNPNLDIGEVAAICPCNQKADWRPTD
jgi:predicted nucleic acid-binding protein